MKKLLFVLTLAFIGQQAFSQIYLVTISSNSVGSVCTTAELTLTKVPPNGTATNICIDKALSSGLVSVNNEFNSIISQGYKLIETSYSQGNSGGGLIHSSSISDYGSTFIFAIPWSASGLEEVATTLNSLSISPNPANEFVNISLSYDLKGESEIVFISEEGYVYHKESIASISKNETYNIDISKIPAGKYLVTIKNGKTYTTPQKLIIV